MRRRLVASILTTGPHVRSIATELCATSCERVAVVLGASAGTITSALDGLAVATLPNVLWSEGIAAAVRCSVAWALRCGADGLLLVRGDEPRVDRGHAEGLLAAFRTTRTPVASYVCGEVTVPAVFGIESFAKLGQLTGDRDARDVLRTTPIVKAVPWPEGAIDRAIDAAIESALGDMLATVETASIPAQIPEILERSEPVAVSLAAHE